MLSPSASSRRAIPLSSPSSPPRNNAGDLARALDRPPIELDFVKFGTRHRAKHGEIRDAARLQRAHRLADLAELHPEVIEGFDLGLCRTGEPDEEHRTTVLSRQVGGLQRQGAASAKNRQRPPAGHSSSSLPSRGIQIGRSPPARMKAIICCTGGFVGKRRGDVLDALLESAGTIEHLLVGAAQRLDRLLREAAALEADVIEAGEAAAPAVDQSERDDVVGDAGDAGDERVSADADELVRRGAAAEDDEVVDLAVAPEHHVVGEDDAFAHSAIVGDVRIGEEHRARPHPRHSPAARGARVHRHPFADQTFFANYELRRLTAIFEVLRRMADRGERIDLASARRYGCRRRPRHGSATSTPSPSFTWRPIRQNGPISTSAPSSAPSSITAFG